MKKLPIFGQIESFFEKDFFFEKEFRSNLKFAIAYFGGLIYNNISGSIFGKEQL